MQNQPLPPMHSCAYKCCRNLSTADPSTQRYLLNYIFIQATVPRVRLYSKLLHYITVICPNVPPQPPSPLSLCITYVSLAPFYSEQYIFILARRESFTNFAFSEIVTSFSGHNIPTKSADDTRLLQLIINVYIKNRNWFTLM